MLQSNHLLRDLWHQRGYFCNAQCEYCVKVLFINQNSLLNSHITTNLEYFIRRRQRLVWKDKSLVGFNFLLICPMKKVLFLFKFYKMFIFIQGKRQNPFLSPGYKDYTSTRENSCPKKLTKSMQLLTELYCEPISWPIFQHA